LFNLFENNLEIATLVIPVVVLVGRKEKQGVIATVADFFCKQKLDIMDFVL